MSEQEQEQHQEPLTEPETGDEPEQGDETPEEPEEPEQPAGEPQEPAEGAISQEQANTAMKKSEQRWKNYRAAVLELWGPYAPNLLDCPLCFDSHKGFVDINDAGQYPEDLKQAALQFLGFSREVEYKQSPRHHACEFCDGEGKVSTGSHVGSHRTVTCPECKGYGYLPPPPPTQASNGVPTDLGTLHELEEPAGATDEVDEWQEPRILPDGRENPNFGRMPHRKILVEPWGVTAGLRANPLEFGAMSGP